MRNAASKIFPSLSLVVLLFAVFSACSSSTSEVMVGGKPRKVKNSITNQFAWAVQSYEAGAYKEAVQRFEKLRKEGSEVPEYDLIFFYLGMSHYKLGETDKAVGHLQSFLRTGTQRQENQDARISLLLAYEKLGRWNESASLAAETDKLTLFQHNRALLKLLWARSLAEQDELQGANAVLESGLSYLDNVGASDKSSFYASSDQDLWGRYYFSSMLVKVRGCEQTQPKEIAKKKRLYEHWLDSVTDCLRGALKVASEELFAKESEWSEQAAAQLARAIDGFATKIQAQIKLESKVLANKRALQKNSSQALYRLLGVVDEHLKIFKERSVSSPPLELLRKQIDRLLVSI